MATIRPVDGAQDIVLAAGDHLIVDEDVTVTTTETYTVLGLGDDIALRNAGSIDGGDAGQALFAGERLDLVNHETGTLAGKIGLNLGMVDSVFLNRGDVIGSTYGLAIANSHRSEIGNFGTISAEWGAVEIFSTATDILLRNSGEINGNGGGSGLSIHDRASVRLINTGTISAENFAVQTFSDGLKVMNKGDISGLYGILATRAVDIINDGTVTGANGAVVCLGFEALNLLNRGTLEGSVGGSETADFTKNQHLIVGPVDMKAGNDLVVNKGTIIGRVDLGEGNDRYQGHDAVGTQLVRGGAGDDFIRGGGQAEVLAGDAGDDTILGGAGGDTIIGGAGRDVLTGGAGADRFVFETVAEFGDGSVDLIRDFTQREDLIDLSAVTSRPLDFNGTTGFSGGGQGSIRYDLRGDRVDVRIDLDGDGARDLRIMLKGTNDLGLSDFLF